MNRLLLSASVLVGWLAPSARADEPPPLSLSWADNMLTIAGKDVPGGALKVWYLEAFCRPGSTDREWDRTVIPHKTELVERSPDGRRLVLRSRLDDGVTVDHEIRAEADAVRFRLVARNPTDEESQAHWAQPCIRVAPFVGVPEERNSENYLPKCFLVVDGKVRRLPTEPWATEARYTPGQVYCPAGVPRADVNPRPLSSLVPSCGLAGCFSADGSRIMAVAWEPFQEVFQGVITCMHTDFRIGGLRPGESKTIRGAIYLVGSDLGALVKRFRADFPEQAAGVAVEE